MPVTREEAYRLIDSELAYEDSIVDSDYFDGLGAICSLKEYMASLDENYKTNRKGANMSIPEQCVPDLLDMAAMLVRLIERNASVRHARPNV